MKFNFHQKNFEEIDLNPEKLAISGSDIDFSWKEVYERTEKLISIFKNLELHQSAPVIIYGHKEASFPLTILACIKSNITYIPIDTIYPDERVRKIIEISNSQLIINCTDKSLNFDIPVIINKNYEVSIGDKELKHNRIYNNPIDPLQYIMFTSGSTGEPKGVQITQNSIISYLDWAIEAYGFKESDVFLNQAPFTFDVSLCDILNAFSLGGSLILTSSEITKKPDDFIARLIQYKCTVWTSTPSFAYMFLRHPEFNSNSIPSLKCFLFMGEDLPNRTCKHLKTTFSDIKIYNAYGPTEATIVTTLIEITGDILEKYTLLPIGFPKTNGELLILKENEEDKEGELVIVGEHVSIGYFNNDEFTKDKFFTYNNQRAFKTGDLAYYQDNMFFCLGRNDDQVKLHGYRIELDEISNVICKEQNVKDAITLPLKRNNEVKKIISIIILGNKENELEFKTKLLEKLEKTLPYYMIPSDIIFTNSFPYNVSHKIDKKKLIEDYLKNI